MFDIDDQRLAPRLSRHDREMVGIAGAADLDRIEADEPRRADARPEAEIARVAAADAVVEQRFGRFEVEAAVAIVPGGALAEHDPRIAAPGRKAVDRKTVVVGKDVSVGVES